MKRLYIISIFILIQTLGFSQDSLKKTFVTIQFGGLKQINIDNNERKYYSYCAGFNIGFKTKKNSLTQTGIEYYRVNFYTKDLNSGPGGSFDSDNYFQFDKFCIPLYFNYITNKNNLIIGGGPVIDLINNYKHSFVRVNFDQNTYVWSRESISEKVNDYSPLYLSLAAKADYLINLGRLKLLIGPKFKFAIYNRTFYTNKGNTAIKFRDVNCSVNLGVMF
ncbi:hypothetical protein [Flavobacterium filum]|jgi:hypothetical protein|uniref:hypothetical protein n=1 Tax=Flavobacterium filum TaxID=370974 RepID=UPI0023F3CE86|nr:hypothetical protein [Flavobacterium filum]